MKLTNCERLEYLSKLTLEHKDLKARVKKLEQQLSRSSAQQVEISDLKKRKLLTKDRILDLQQN